MGNMQEALYEAMRKFVAEKTGCKVKQVTGYDDFGKPPGCETCGYGASYTFYIYYQDSDGFGGVYNYKGPFSALIKELSAD